MIYKHKNLHVSEPNPRASALRINRNQAAAQLEALGYSRSNAVYVRAFLNWRIDADAVCTFLTTFVIEEVL